MNGDQIARATSSISIASHTKSALPDSGCSMIPALATVSVATTGCAKHFQASAGHHSEIGVFRSGCKFPQGRQATLSFVLVKYGFAFCNHTAMAFFIFSYWIDESASRKSRLCSHLLKVGTTGVVKLE
jgi:hypothetical protein